MENMQHEHPYRKMALMLAVSFVIMYGVMFLNVAEAAHIYFSATRTYMTLLMVAPMALLMLLVMSGMYPNKKRNALIGVGAVAVFVGALAGLRSQTFVSDDQYMKAMIPHHSSAIMVSRAGHFKDPELAQLARDIIAAQEREIARMEAMLRRHSTGK